MRRLLVNDCLDTLGQRTFWHDLREWFDMEFVGGEYTTLADSVKADGASLIVRNATWFPPIKAACPQISLLQDIITEGPQREMQEQVMVEMPYCHGATVYNSKFTRSHYGSLCKSSVIPLPVDFSLFDLGNPMGLQQALSLPDGCVLWVGASQQAGHVKGWDIFLSIVRQNPDIQFVAVFKDQQPPYAPPNLRMYTRLSQEELAKVMGACRVGLCTSRMESQHLAGIEMGACGLPLVVPPVGAYWKREGMPGVIVEDGKPESYAAAIRHVRGVRDHPKHIRAYWRAEFDREIVKAEWTKLIEEVERAVVDTH